MAFRVTDKENLQVFESIITKLSNVNLLFSLLFVMSVIKSNYCVINWAWNRQLPLSDIDECIEEQVCGQNSHCHNTNGSFYCTCQRDYIQSSGSKHFHPKTGVRCKGWYEYGRAYTLAHTLTFKDIHLSSSFLLSVSSMLSEQLNSNIFWKTSLRKPPSKWCNLKLPRGFKHCCHWCYSLFFNSYLASFSWWNN